MESMGSHAMLGSAQVFQDVKVAEFTGFAAGPGVGKHLADHGAQVVKVESSVRPDGFRSHYPPFKDNETGINRSGCFALYNNSKLSITLNLKDPRGMQVAREIVARSDVVIENFTPGTMARLGLDYESLRDLKPDTIMLSTCNLGQTGPRALHPGFGSHLTSLSGFTQLTGYPDGPPLLLYGPYIDFIAVGFAAIAVTAALDYRRRTGRGMYIDNSQYENGLQFLAPALMDFSSNGRVPARDGNRSPEAAPHGVYPCQGDDRWCALSVWSQEQWAGLCKAMGSPGWCRDPRFLTHEARKENEAELDRLVARWTRGFQAEDITRLLQRHGVPAGLVNNMEDLFNDPQLRERGFWSLQDHPEMGPHHYASPPFLLSRSPARLHSPSPCLGQHNRQFFVEALGMAESEYGQLVEEGAIA